MSASEDRLHQSKHAEDDVLWGNDYKSQNVTSRPVSVGFSLDGKIGSGQTVLSPKLRYAFKQETASLERKITAASLAAPGFYWTTNGVEPPKDEHLLDLDLKLRITKYSHLSLQLNRNWSKINDIKGGSIKFERVF